MSTSLFTTIDISEYLNQGVLVLNVNGAIVGWNKWLIKRSGLSLEEVEHKLLVDVYPALKERPSFSRLMSAFNTNGAVILSPAIHHYFLPLEPTLSQKSKGVSIMYQLVQGQMIEAKGEKLLLIFITDMTENYLLNKRIQTNFQEIQKKNEQLDRARQYTNSFLANMSHELRTPLNSIMVLSQLLEENKKGTLSEEDVHFAQTIHRSGKGLLSLINDVLDLAKVEAGRLDVVMETFAVADLIQEQKDNFGVLARNRDFDFLITIADDVPEFFYGDSHRIAQIVRNFLSNAFKFTKSGMVTFRVERRKNWEHFVDALCFVVTDTGIGIPEEKMEEIFEAFKQVDGTTSREYGGTGLGLSISKELASILGGSVQATSEEGKGSTFILALPIDEKAVQDNPPSVSSDTPMCQQKSTERCARTIPRNASSQTPQIIEGDCQCDVTHLQKLRNKKVLLVESSIRDVYIVTAALEKCDINVMHAVKSAEGLGALRKNGADILIIDSDGNEKDSMKAIETIREGEEYFRLPIFVFTSADESQRKALITSGADEVLVKPVKMDILSRMMCQYLKSS